MPYIKVGEENTGDIQLYYEDHGVGKPVVLIHGWPLSGQSWEKQMVFLLNSGYRVITYDRRGFGMSSKPIFGYEYHTLAKDLHQLMVQLDLRDATLVGFSMGTGEVARYLGTYGSERVAKAVFLAPILPFLLKTQDNRDGVENSIFEAIQKSILKDRPAYLFSFLSEFYNFNVLGGERISNEVVQYNWNTAVEASPKGTLDCVQAWLTDFREELTRIAIPTLIIQGDADRILPLASTGTRLHQLLEKSRLVVLNGAPHGLLWTHAEEINRELLNFLGQVKGAEEARRKAG